MTRSAVAAGVALALCCGVLPALDAADSQTDAKAASKTESKAESKEDSKAQKKKKLTGAELYSIHCNRCHTERYPTEWNSREWETIMLQMRVRANLPAGQAKEILKYLKEESSQ